MPVSKAHNELSGYLPLRLGELQTPVVGFALFPARVPTLSGRVWRGETWTREKMRQRRIDSERWALEATQLLCAPPSTGPKNLLSTQSKC